MSFILDKLAPQKYASKDAYYYYLVSSAQKKTKTVLEVLEMWCFSYSAFWSTCQWESGGYNPPRLPGYATGTKQETLSEMGCGGEKPRPKSK